MLTIQLTLTTNKVNVRANGKESHSFSLGELNWPQTKAQVEAFVSNPKETRKIGANLFQALFKDGSPARAEFDALSKQSERTIVLVLESSELDGVAWEYAYNRAKEEYVVEDCAFVRALPEKERPENGRMKNEVERMPLLFIPANPLVDLNGEPMRALDVEGEWKVITRHILTSNAPFDLYQLLPATPEDLQTVLANFRDGLIVHFSGHGSAAQEEAMLLFEEKNGRTRVYPASNFVRTVKDQALLVFLSACQSAVAGKTKFSNLARNLVQNGVPFALGMQFDLPDKYDDVISQQFYNFLARGFTIPQAVLQARRAIKDAAIKEENREFYIGLIALYAAHPDEVGKLSWRGTTAQTISLFRPADVSDLPAPASGLIGRQRELMEIGTRLLEDKKPLTVTLHGAGGIGKTALLCEALLRFAPSFELTLAIGLDPLPSLESVLGRIERFLLVPSPCSNDTKEREALVRNALTSKRTLLGLDNFETLNYALNEKGSDEEKIAKSLHTFFKSLAANGVTLCVTSREITKLGGEHVKEIQGLTNESGGRLFQENVSEPKQKKQIYIEKTQQVSEMVGGHPLALRLLASAFDDQVGTSLDQYIEDLQSFLPKARDKWTEEDRHESLRASFDFTINNLVKTDEGRNLQIALSRLSVFIAFFANFTAAPVLKNRFPEKGEDLVEEMMPEASKILHALWERSLLERIAISLEEENSYLYRLHPTLGSFAQECLTNAETAKENYWQSMRNLVRIAEEESTKNPLVVQIALYALPDLFVAAELKNNEEAATMQYDISVILWQLGLYDDALRLLAKSRDLYENLNQNVGVSNALFLMASIYTRRGNLEGAMKVYQQVQEIDKGLDYLSGSPRTLFSMAHILQVRGDLEGAMKLYQQALEIEQEQGNLTNKSEILYSMAQILQARGEMDDAMRLCQQALQIKEELGDLRGKAVAIGEIGMIYLAREDLVNALEMFKQKLAITKVLGDQRETSVVLHNIANIYVKRGDLEGALKLYRQSYEIDEGMGNLRDMAATLNNIGVVLFQNNRYADALRALLSALEIRIQLQAELDIESTIISLLRFKQGVGVEAFRNLYKEVTGSEQFPEWLSQSSQ